MMAFQTLAFVNNFIIILECHYTCENCNGPLQTNCTSCSSSSNRHLTSDKQCLCNKAYIDDGTNNINCLCILFNIIIFIVICHHTC